MIKGLFFDIGANVGEYTQYLLSQGAEKVVAVEPNPDLADYLMNKRFLGDSRVSVLAYAVSDKPGLIPFRISNASTISTCDEDWVNKSRFTGQFHWAPPIQVPTISIDSLVDIYGVPQALKVDVEGYEIHALCSLTRPLSETEVSFEWHEEKWDETVQCVEHLATLGLNWFGYILNTNQYHERPSLMWTAEDLLRTMRENHVAEGRRVNMGMIFARTL